MNGEKSIDAANCQESSKIAGLGPKHPPPPNWLTKGLVHTLCAHCKGFHMGDFVFFFI